MPIVLISESLLLKTTEKDGRILRDRVLCGFIVKLNDRKRTLRVASLGQQGGANVCFLVWQCNAFQCAAFGSTTQKYSLVLNITVQFKRIPFSCIVHSHHIFGVRR